MSSVLMSLAALLGVALPMLIDSALKGAALLALAGVVALAARKASAARRHLVWFYAVTALLGLPVLSALLPGWRVLPSWTAMSEPAMLFPSTESRPAAPVLQPPGAAPAPEVFPVIRESLWPRDAAEKTFTIRDWLPLVWAGGFALLVIRLLAAYWRLRRVAKGCAEVTDGRLAQLLEATRRQLAIRQPVELLIDSRRTIPMVWGLFRPRLLLPVEALEWSDRQLRSVFLHELAHVKRRDMAVQWLMQLACALHWFNPLIWFAAWRLHVEGERACDDLVLAGGVRASEYAEHLLHVATKLVPAHRTQIGGLAMARPSRLEGRLLAVLNGRLNRHGVTRTLALAALVLGLCVTIPLAMLCSKAENRGANSSTPSFAPVIERWLEAKTECFLDLDTGQTHGPVIIGGESDLPRGMDISIVRFEKDFTPSSVVGLDDLAAVAATSADWEISPLDLEKRLKTVEGKIVGGATKATPLASGESQFPRTYLFRTSKGNNGVLQIVGFRRNPGGVKIRYKLMWADAGARAHAPSANPTAEGSQAGLQTDNFPATEQKPNAPEYSSLPKTLWTVTGQVTDPEGKPLADVEIWVHTGMGTLKRVGTATTGADGRYTVSFGRGVLRSTDDPNLQFAQVTAHKAGLFERNLNRDGGRAAALREVSPQALKGFGVTAEQLFLPDKPQTIDFVMMPAGRIKGRLLGTGAFPNLPPQETKSKKNPQPIGDFRQLQQSPLAGWRVWLIGQELPPGCSVLDHAKTDAEGNFFFESVPTGFVWQFQADTHRRQAEPKSPPFKLEHAGEALFDLEIREDQKAIRFLRTP